MIGEGKNLNRQGTRSKRVRDPELHTDIYTKVKDKVDKDRGADKYQK